MLPRVEYDALDKYSTSLQLEIGTMSPLQNLSIVQAQCVTRGVSSDPGALYLIELTDGRGVLHNRWFHFPLTAAYNIRAPAYPQTFYTASLNSGTTWTWSTMLQSVWELMGDFLGPWPGLPSSPLGTPEGFWFTGVPAWTALCDVLEHLGMTVACDLASATPFTIVEVNASDSAFDALTAANVPNLQDDLEWLDVGAARVPKTITVLFPRRNAVYGTEETVTHRSDGIARQWAMDPHYEVVVQAPSDFSSAVGKHYIWSDYTVRYDDDGQPLSADVTEAEGIARQRADQYYAGSGAETYVTRTYAGAVPFATGSRVDGVCWKQDYESRWHAWRTELVCGPSPPWPELWEARAP